MNKVLFIIALSLLQLPAEAKKLYKYKDEQGHWHFSDKPPKTQQKVDVRQLKASSKRYVWLEKTGAERHPEYFVINNYPGPIELDAKLTEINNVQSTPALPNRFIIPPGRTQTLFKISAIDQYKGSSYTLQYSYTIGDPNASHDINATYLPPFARSFNYPISQAFGGKFSHTDIQNKYAVDIVMPVDTPIHAARSGIVLEVNNDYFNSGTEQSYKSRANSIRILHEDGSMAVYAHLALEKAQVYPGLTVYAGQLIGYSGNTGYSTGPHLHFAVQINKGMKLVSIPFKFTSSDGIASKPAAGSWLQN